jgi:transketolase
VDGWEEWGYLAAAESLSESGISIRVIDCYSIKPLDKQGILDAIEATREKVVITVEDHFEHGGFGDFVLDALRDTQAEVVKLAVKNISKSGKKEELMHEARIGRDAIIEEVRKVIQS